VNQLPGGPGLLFRAIARTISDLCFRRNKRREGSGTMAEKFGLEDLVQLASTKVEGRDADA
jgi:hypothetical protein